MYDVNNYIFNYTRVVLKSNAPKHLEWSNSLQTRYSNRSAENLFMYVHCTDNA